jgi:diguanylate cyclase (GGDEF)-like protein/PAS domain S-box-containing protein
MKLHGNASWKSPSAEELERLSNELQRRSDYLRALIDNFPFPIWLKDEESRLLAANAAYAALAGVASPQELELHTDFDFFPPDLAQGYVRDDKNVMASGKPKNLIEEFVDEAGQHHWIDTYKSPVVVNGETAGTVGFFRDVTQLRQLEIEAAERKRYLETIIANSPDVIVRYDRECRRVFVSDNYEKFYGQSASSVLGKTPLEAWSGLSIGPEAFMQQLQHIYASGQPADIESGLDDHPDFWLLMRCAPEFDEQGNIASILSISRNIGALKKAERQLQEITAQYRSLAEHSPDYIIRYNPEIRRTYVNTQFCKDMERSESELLQHRPIDDHIESDRDIPEYVRALQTCFRTGQPSHIEIGWHNDSGQYFCTHFRLTPELDDEGRVGSVLAIGRDISDIDRYRQQIHQLAYFDTLTGLPNRTMFKQQVATLIDADTTRRFGLMMLDLDRFKEINDSMGHGMGDLLLQEVAHRIQHSVRDGDIVSRLGGDEFAILLPGMQNADDMDGIARQIVLAFARPAYIQSRELFVTPSIGIAFYPADSGDIEGLLRYADSAMYHAKQQGRNNYQFYTSDLTERIAARIKIQTHLRTAIKRNELELYFQPQVRLSDSALIGAEALLRWHHPDGDIPPESFIPAAEESGLIVEIGDWILEEAFVVARDWNLAHLTSQPFVMAVNLSGRQFIHNDLVGTIRRLLQKTGCDPAWIELEITESLLLESDRNILAMLNQMGELGMSIAIDDFGTGYSSLAYLSRFPIDQIKIDRSFVQNLTLDPDADSLVQAILSLSASMHKSSLAEGVETVEQAIFLRASGCARAQGYLYGKPMPRHAFEKHAITLRTYSPLRGKKAGLRMPGMDHAE